MPPVRRLTAIFAADVAGYSRLMGADEEGTHERLQAHLRELVNPKINEHRGRIVKNTGDGFLAEFPSVVDAVRCAVEVQRGMAQRNVETSPEQRIEFRVGINLGDVIAEGEDIFGDGVNVAARLEALAEPGGVFVSNTVHEHARDRLPFVFEDLGEQQVKNIARPVRAYRVRHRDIAWEEPPAALQQPLPLPDKPSIAVLPFQNMSSDPEQEYFADGMVEEIITALSRIRWLFVIARNSSFTYKSKAVDVKQVGRELGVRYILEGSVRKAGNRVRITPQLIDTTTNAHIWVGRFDGVLDDIFELQDQVASKVAGAIEPRLRLSEIERATRKPTKSLDAYDLYLRALAQFHKYSKETLYEAVALLERALAIDPSYVPAAAMIGFCRAVQKGRDWGSPSDAEIEDGLRFARQALAAGKDDPDALWMGGWTIAYLGGETSHGARAIERALAFNPNSALAWMASGYVSCYRNQPGPAIEAFEHAIRLSPFDQHSWDFAAGLGLAHLLERRYDKAIEWAERSLRELPYFAPMIRLMVVCCAHLGRFAEAHAWLERLLALQPGLTIAKLKASVAYSPEHQSIRVEGFRKAGLPEE
jgi:TolB-like protein/class 3 adenylate cyclase